jgi:AcrR family transcriptional regulator
MATGGLIKGAVLGRRSGVKSRPRGEPKRRSPPEISSDDVFESTSRQRLPGVDQKYRTRYLEVLTAAARQFSERGYQATTTKHIGDDLGVQQGSLYYYIPSKEHALEQICTVAIDGYVKFSVRVKNSRTPVAEKIRELVRLHLSTLEIRPSFFRVFQENRKDLGDDARHRIGAQIREYEKNVETIFRQGVRHRQLRRNLDTQLAALTLLGACNAVSVWWGKRTSAPISMIAEHIADMALQGTLTYQTGQ